MSHFTKLLFVGLVFCVSLGCKNDLDGIVGKGNRSVAPDLVTPEQLERLTELADRVKAVSELLSYGEGIPGALTFEEMQGQGNCGHFTILTNQILSSYSPQGVSLYSRRGAIHRVTALVFEGRQIVVDGTAGVIYPYSIEDLVAWPSLAHQVIGEIQNPSLLIYGPELYSDIEVVDRDSLGGGIVGAASIRSSSVTSPSGNDRAEFVRIPLGGGGVRVLGLRLRSLDESLFEEVPIVVELRRGDETVFRHEMDAFLFDGRLDFVLPEVISADEMIVEGGRLLLVA